MRDIIRLVGSKIKSPVRDFKLLQMGEFIRLVEVLPNGEYVEVIEISSSRNKSHAELFICYANPLPVVNYSLAKVIESKLKLGD